MTQNCTTYDFNQQADRLDFFQQMIFNGLQYWLDHAAFQNTDVPILDQERDGIISALRRGLEFDQAWPQTLKLIDGLAAYMERRGYWSMWRAVLEQAVATSQRVGDVAGETTMTALLARLSQRQSRSEDVVRYYRRVIRLAKQSDNQYELARACSNLGYYFIDASRWWRSEVLSLRALEIFEELGSEHGLAHTHNHLGLLYTRQGKMEQANLQFKSARKIWQTNKDSSGLLTVYLNLSNLYVEIGEPQSAIEKLERASKIAQKSGETSIMARIWNNMAIAHRQSLNWIEAKKYVRKAEACCLKYSDSQQLANVWHNFGLILHHEGESPQALDYFQKSLQLHERLNNQDGITKVKTAIAIAICGGHDTE